MSEEIENTNKPWGHWIYLSIIIILTVLSYSNVLHGELQFDDRDYLFSSPLVKSPSSFMDTDLWSAFKGGMRPVTAFTFSLNYHFWGSGTFSYHLTNLFIHIINGVLVYILIYMTLSRLEAGGQRSESSAPQSSASRITFLTSLFFSLHPVQTESVSYIYQRSESLSSMFYLLSLMSFIAAAIQLEGRGQRSEAKSSHLPPPTSVGCYLLFIAGFIFALGSKEIAVTLPLTTFLYGIFFFEKNRLWEKVAIPGLLLIAGLIVAAARLIALRENPSAGFYLKEFTAWEYLITQFSVIVNYIRLLIMPFGQNIDHFYPVSRSLFEARTLVSFFILTGLLASAGLLYKRRRTESFFIFWFFITLLPSSSILPIKDVFVEHRLYLPAIGPFFLIASGIAKISEMRRRSFIVSVSLLTSVLFASTYNRNALWNSMIAMWEDAVRKAPQNFRAHNNLGVAYSDKELYDRAIEHYQIALTLKRDFADPYTNLGFAYFSKGLNEKAMEYYRMALRLKPDDTDAHYNLGVAYSEMGLLEQAIEEYQAVLRLKPDRADARNNLGNCLLILGDYKNALREYIETLRLDPNNFEAYYNAGLSLENRGLKDMAREFFIVFVKKGPEGYEKEIGELKLKYDIREGTPMPEIRSLIKRSEVQ